MVKLRLKHRARSKLLVLGKARKDYIAAAYRYKLYILLVVALLIPVAAAIYYNTSRLRADADEEPYSIFILAGQSLAAGVESYRSQLEPGRGSLTQQYHDADDVTKLWWAGSNGEGLDTATTTALFPDIPDVIKGLVSGNTNPGTMGWAYSSNVEGTPATSNRQLESSKRLQNNLNGSQVLHSAGQSSGLFGSEFGIARTLYAMGRRKVIILKVTYGFQSLSQSNSPLIPFDWNVNSTSNDADRPKSYQQLKKQFTDLTNYLKSNGEKYTVDGIFWMQGETDTLNSNFASSYQTNLTNLVNNARQDLQLHPYGHFVIGKTSMQYCVDNSWPRQNSYCDYPSAQSIDPPVFVNTLTQFIINPIMPYRINQVRAAQQAVADSDQNTTQKVDIVETNDLEHTDVDWTHLTAYGEIELGRRFVSMYKLPLRYTDGRATDYDQDGILNSAEDTGRGASCPLSIAGQVVNASGNGNLGDDDADCDSYPNYLDRTNGPGSGL